MKQLFSKLLDMVGLMLLVGLLLLILLPKRSEINNLNQVHKAIENPRDFRRDSAVFKIAMEKLQNPLNPFFESTRKPSFLTRLIHRPLYKRDIDGLYEADLAENYWQDDEGKSLHIILKKGLRFPSGKEVLAQDLLDNYKVLADSDYDGLKSTYVSGIKGYYKYKMGKDETALSIDVVGQHYLRIVFNEASKDNLKILQLPIVDLSSSNISYGNLSAIKDKEFSNGLGLYKLASFGENSFTLELKKRDNDFIESIRVFHMSDLLANEMLKSGVIDIAYDYYKIGTNQDVMEKHYVIARQDESYLLLGFNLRDKLFKDDKLRLALRDSFDFNHLLGYEPSQKLSIAMYENSKFLLKDSFERSGLELKDLTKDLDDKTVKLAVYKGLNEVKLHENKLKNAFKNQGLDLKIFYLDDKEYYQVISGNNPYDMFIRSGQMFIVPSVENQMIYNKNWELSVNSLNDYDNINRLESISKVYGYSNYKDAMEEWQRWFYKMSPYIPIKVDKKKSLINNSLKGLSINEFVGVDSPENLKFIKNVINK